MSILVDLLKGLLGFRKAAEAQASDSCGIDRDLFVRRHHAETEASLREAIRREPDCAEAYGNLGDILIEQGRLAEGEASYREAIRLKSDFVIAHGNLGVALQNQGRLSEAEACYREAILLQPDFAEVHSNLGFVLADQGLFVEAETSCREAIRLKPEYAEAHNNLGNALMDQERLGEAEASYREAIRLKQDFAEAHSNLGAVVQAQGRLAEAEASYREAIRLKPDFVAYCNLGIVLRDQGRLIEAEAGFREAIWLNPDYAEAYNILGSTLRDLGRPEEGLGVIIQSLKLKESPETKCQFVECVKGLHVCQVNDCLAKTLVRAVSEPWGRPCDLAKVCTELIKLDPVIGKCIRRAADAWPGQLSSQDLYENNSLNQVTTHPLLIALLHSAPNGDIEMERFLTMARRDMLETAMRPTGLDRDGLCALSFYCALACQCFINEYVFFHRDEEIQKANTLRNSLLAALEANTEIPVLWPVTVAAYFPLFSLPSAARLVNRKWPDEVMFVLNQQIREPEEEQKLRPTISVLTDIDDLVSLQVQNQYEENPYPRWIKTASGKKPKAINTVFRRKFPLSTFQPLRMSDPLHVLVAGCGTGQHPIGTSQQFQGARILAIDLSMASLCYAKRKTQEMGVNSIEYAQADLLELGALDRSFDVIESSGVLHHLADPWSGWRILLSLLRPGGLMRLGLYSEAARRNIVRINEYIAKHGLGATEKGIREFRQKLIDLDAREDFGTTLRSSCFFSISTCRDLLFHVQEHRMTLKDIGAFIMENDLVFLGFEMEPEVLRAYKLRFPNDLAATNLNQWHIFEDENPDTFIGMYQFWVQKPDYGCVANLSERDGFHPSLITA